ncbi:MAG: beta-galactosidase [Armatimonadetes bacterium]|nr:beta-galactosidase [Armatimonadota bacterium]
MRFPRSILFSVLASLALALGFSTRGAVQDETRNLADFEGPADLTGWSSEAKAALSISTDQAAHGKSSLKMQLPAGPYPGVYCDRTGKDWSGYGGLAFDLHLPDKATLGVRVDDENSAGYESRFNMDNLPLRPGWNAVFVPLRKVADKVDLKKIRALAIYLLDMKQDTTVYLDNVRLLRVSDKLLNGFEKDEDVKGVSAETKIPMALSAEQHTQGEKSLRLTLQPGPYPGVFLSVPPDWRGQEALKFDLWCQRNSSLGIRIDDQHSMDYNTRYNQDGGVVREGWNRVQVSLDEVAKSISLGEVKSVIVFLMNVAEPTTVYLDNVRLGAYQEGLDDRPIPGELGEKKEFKWSTEIETPHISWAKPLAGGKIKALLVPGIHAGREAIELLQRVDLDADIVTIEKTWDVNRWGMGDHYGDRGDRGDFRLQYRYLQQAMTSDKQYDVIVLPLVHGWNALTPKTRQALKQRVRDGTGLVLIHPYIGRDGSDASIWELSPLTGCPDDFMPEDGYVRIAPGSLAAGHPVWRAAGEHFITRGIPLDLLPFASMEQYKYASRGTTILESDGGPVAAVKEFGKGRVVAFGYRNCDILPNLEGDTYPTYDYHEYLYSLMAKALLWAAKKERAAIASLSVSDTRSEAKVSVVKGASAHLLVTLKNELGQVKQQQTVQVAEEATSAAIPLPPAQNLDAGRQIVDVIAMAGKEVVDWASLSFELPKPLSVQNLLVSTEPVKQGDPVKVGILVQRSDTPPLQQTQITLDLMDEEDRVIARETFDFQPDMAGKQWKELTLPTDKAFMLHARVVASTKAGDRLLDRRESRPFVITPEERQPEGLNFHAVMSGVNTGNFPYLATTFRQRLRDMGTEAGTTFGGIPNSLGVSGMGVYAYDAAPYRDRKRQYQATKDKQFLIRQPCLNSETWRKQTRENVLAYARRAMPYNPFSYYVNDEGSLTSYTDPFDLCFGSECLTKFREWLKTVYPSLDALNDKWQAKFAKWEDVIPMTTEEVKAHVEQPKGKTTRPTYAAWADHRTFMERTYSDAYKFIRDCLHEVDPQGELRISGTQATTAYDGCDWSRITEFARDTGPYTTGDQWDLHRSFLFDSGAPDGRSGGWTGYGSSGAGVQHSIWNGLFHRIGYMNIFWQYACLNPDLTFSQSAKDMAVAFRELSDGVGMLLNHARRSPTPVAVHYSLASCHAATILGQEAEWNRARENTIALLNDLGWQFNFVSSQQVEAGALSKHGYKAIVLPWSVAMSDREVAALRQFEQAGGALIVWGSLGAMDEHCALREGNPLQDIVPKSSAWEPAVSSPKVAVIPSGCMDYATDREMGYKVKLRLDFFYSMRTVTDGLPGEVLDGKKHPWPLTHCQRTYFTDDEATYVCLLRDNLSGERVVGPDGVEYVKDTGTKAGPEPITLRLRRPAHVYDVRLGKYLGKIDRVDTNIAPAEAKVFALLPSRVTKVTVSGPSAVQPGQPATITLNVRTDGKKPMSHVLHVEVLLPAGTLHPLYTRNLVTTNGAAKFAIPFAFNDEMGEWTIKVKDVASGATGEAKVRLK